MESIRASGGALGAQASQEQFECSGGAFNLNCDSVRVIADESGQPLLESKAVDEGAKANTLHHAANRDDAPLRRFVRFSY